MADPRITLAELKKAHKRFEAEEPRSLFYHAAKELVDLSLRGRTKLSVAEALAVLLKTWNSGFYRFHIKFDETHFERIEKLLLKHRAALAAYRKQSIDNLNPREEAAIIGLFQEFEQVLGPVGAAKALHLLAPRLFPLWDNAIAIAYHLRLGRTGSNGDRCWRFILLSQRQCSELKRGAPSGWNLLKSIDEYNYCRYSMK